jgi:hypothetical protein
MQGLPKPMQKADGGRRCGRTAARVVSRGFQLLLVFFGKGTDPVEYSLSRDAQEERDAVHRAEITPAPNQQLFVT